MNDFEHFLICQKAGSEMTVEEHLTNKVNNLLMCLQKPTKEGFRIDWQKVIEFGIDKNEPVNWADLGCASVTCMQDYYEIIIEEASPDKCPTLCAYIENTLASLGWVVEVNTEW